MEFKIKYFKDYVPFHVDDSHHPVELNPKQCPAVESEAAEVRRALAHPIGTPRLSEIVKPGEKWSSWPATSPVRHLPGSWFPA